MNHTLQHLEDSAADQFGLKIAARLDVGIEELPYDISERLRAARQQALAKRKMATAGSVVRNGKGTAALHLGSEWFGLWGRVASIVPLVALVMGLFAIQKFMDEDRANELAEVDTALLTDDLPPEAYADSGFVQFLKTRSASAN